MADEKDPLTLGHSLWSWRELSAVKTIDLLKQLLGSKTIIGVLILLVNNTILKDAPIDEAVGQEAAVALDGLLNAIGTVLAVWGRLTARGPMIGNSIN